MSGRTAKRLRAAARRAKLPAKANRAKKVFLLATPVVLIAIAATSYLAFFRDRPASKASQPYSYPPLTYTQKVKSLDDLLKMTPEQLTGADIAEMNLLCAAGLPGGENLDIARCLRRLDEWATKVRYETERHLYRAHDPKWANHYKHSENWLRCEFLAQVLQEDCGVHYNMERARNIDFTKSKDLFIHGMIDDDNGGTCASMPVLYVAVGRRLGYPLNLVTTKAHVFVRWDDGKERFNIETTSSGGTDNYDDEHYRNWPAKWTEAEAKANRYLVSLSPAEELAQFLGNRGHCLLDNGRVHEAMEAYATARKLAPQDPAYLSWLHQADVQLHPPAYAAGPPGYAEPPLVYRQAADPLAEIDRINAINGANRQRLAPPLPGMPNPYQPYPLPVPGQPPR